MRLEFDIQECHLTIFDTYLVVRHYSQTFELLNHNFFKLAKNHVETISKFIFSDLTF